MATQKMLSFSMLKTHFDFVDKGFLEEFVYRTMFTLANYFWVLACKFLFYLYGIAVSYIFRLEADDSSQRNDCNCRVDHSQRDDQIDSGSSTVLEPDGSGKKENLDFFFGFQFQNSETENSVFLETSPTPNTSKCQVVSGKDSRGFMEEPETMSFTIQEIFVGSNDDQFVHKGHQDQEVQEFLAGSNDLSEGNDHIINQVSVDEDFQEFNSKTEASILEKAEEKAEDSVESSCSESVLQKPEEVISTEYDLHGNKEMVGLEYNHSGPNHFSDEVELHSEGAILEKAEDSVASSSSENVLEKAEQVISNEYDLHGDKETAGLEHDHSGPNNFSDEVELLSEIQFSPSDSELESSSSTEGIPIRSRKVDSVSIESYSDSFVYGGLEPDNPISVDEKRLEFTGKIPNSEEICIRDTSIFYREPGFSRDKAEDTDDEFIELELDLQCSSHLDISFLRKNLGRVENNHEQENLDRTGVEPIDSLGESEESSFQKKSWVSDSEEDEDDEFDILLKHQDLIEQVKVEMKNARTKGLPPIYEESETPKMVEDLKPLKIDEKFEHKDRMKEIQKVYKSYADKMRKLDILNYQTLHAISFLQLKDPVQQALGQKSSVSAIKSLIFPNLWPCKQRRIHADPTLKSISELQRKLEMVYVGQACLSWEILHWQYGKANELLQHDSEGHRPYNQVACEFQQFQVLVQRFVENEQFQGPRVQNYAKNRCDLRSLLQVPAIKDDCSKDSRDEGENVVSIATLAETIDESMRVFWEFLHADKDEANSTFKGLPTASQVDLQDPSDSERLVNIKTSLQKKEKRLKDILRSGNCIVKKFQKQQEGRMDHALLFAQVELKLVSRVINMSRLTTDQLVWCEKKLNKISFFSRKIHVEPSFLLFPI